MTSPLIDESDASLELDDLRVSYRVRDRAQLVVRGVSLRVAPGESYGLVGESGCGKTTVAFAALRYLPRNGAVNGGTVRVAGTNPYALSRRQLRQFHRNKVSMVYQNPATALNPTIRVGKQLAEVYDALDSNRKESVEKAYAALQRVQIADPGAVMKRYPYQLSGGMQQRVVIAMALATNPALLLLDEPTTGLDVTVEAEILDLIAQMQAESHTAVLFITHNLGVIARMCRRVGVLYAGRLVEEGATEEVLHNPRHPYTIGLIRCIPKRAAHKNRDRLDTIPGLLPPIGQELAGCVFADRCLLAQDICTREEPPLHQLTDGHTSRCHFHDRAAELPRATVPDIDEPVPSGHTGTPLLSIERLTKVFQQHGPVHALTEVSAMIWPGETLGLVGESGSGKTTLAHSVLGIVEPTSGSVELEGRPLAPRLSKRKRKDVRDLQLVFQNPDSALNQSHRVDRILRQALKQLAGMKGEAARRRMLELTDAVRLAPRYLTARPRQLSGGLKQRVSIACAFAGDPRLVICDEPTSALDVSVQAAILNLLVELQASRHVSYLFISHDLGVVRYISDRIAVLYLGRLMEVGTAEAVFAGPHHPYTEALLSALPTVDGKGRERIKLRGEVPSAATPPSGCVFHTRCHRKVGAICEQVEPPLIEAAADHLLRCHIPLNELGRDADHSIESTDSHEPRKLHDQPSAAAIE